MSKIFCNFKQIVKYTVVLLKIQTDVVQDMIGGGVQQKKRQRTSCDFPGGMIFLVLFCSLFEDILLTKSGKNNKKEQKRT